MYVCMCVCLCVCERARERGGHLAILSADSDRCVYLLSEETVKLALLAPLYCECRLSHLSKT